MIHNTRFFLFGIFCLLLLLLAGYGSHTETAVANGDNTLYLPVISNIYDPQFPGTRFGMQTYTSTDSNNAYYPALIDSGADWVRARVRWIDVEPADVDPANYNWTIPDTHLAVARSDKGGLNIICVIGFVPEWAQLIAGTANGPIKASAMADFAEFVQATVERYDGDGYMDAPGRPAVKHWELFNEPDGNERWGNYGAEYADMLAIAYSAIKTADPSAQVLFGGMAYDFWMDGSGNPGQFQENFLEDVLAAGGGDSFDVMNFHMYPVFATNWGFDPIGMRGKAAEIRAKMAAYGLDKPIVITEAGWHNSTNIAPVSSGDAEQVARLVQIFVHSFVVDSKVTIWFNLYDPGDGLPSYGLTRNEVVSNPPERKEAFYAYQTAVFFLEKARSVTDLMPPPTDSSFMEAYRFDTNRGALYVAWQNPFGTGETSTLQIPANTVSVYDATLCDASGCDLNDVSSTITGNNGVVTVPIGDDPVYILVNN